MFAPPETALAMATDQLGSTEEEHAESLAQWAAEMAWLEKETALLEKESPLTLKRIRACLGGLVSTCAVRSIASRIEAVGGLLRPDWLALVKDGYPDAVWDVGAVLAERNKTSDRKGLYELARRLGLPASQANKAKLYSMITERVTKAEAAVLAMQANGSGAITAPTAASSTTASTAPSAVPTAPSAVPTAPSAVPTAPSAVPTAPSVATSTTASTATASTVATSTAPSAPAIIPPIGEIEVRLVRPGALLPARKVEQDFDIFSGETAHLSITQATATIDTGIEIRLPMSVQLAGVSLGLYGHIEPHSLLPPRCTFAEFDIEPGRWEQLKLTVASAGSLPRDIKVGDPIARLSIHHRLPMALRVVPTAESR